MQLELTDDIKTMNKVYKLTIPWQFMQLAEFDAFDRALFDDIENGPKSKTPVADRLLGLETLVRRIEQAKEKEGQDE